jgi:cytochrome b561
MVKMDVYGEYNEYIYNIAIFFLHSWGETKPTKSNTHFTCGFLIALLQITREGIQA